MPKISRLSRSTTQKREVAYIDGMKILVDDERMPQEFKNTAQKEVVRFRTLGCYPLTGAINSDADTTEKLAQGARIREMLKQPQYQPMPVAKQIVIIYAAVKKYLMDIPVEEILHFQDALLELIDTRYPEITGKITETQVIDEETEQKLIAAIQETKKEYLA